MESELKRKDILKKIRDEMGDEELSNYLLVEKELNNGKIAKAEEIINSILGKKQTEKLMKDVNQNFASKKHKPL
jgi:hypothetical protein